MGSTQDTLTTFGDRHRTAQPAGTRPYVFLVLECDRPAAPSLRCSLSGIDEVVLGRGPARSAERRSSEGVTALRVAVDDPRMSSEHARFERAAGRWVLLDRSKNGTNVNGAPVERHVLEDGDILQLGRTLFLFRAALPARDDEPDILDAGDLAERPPGWRTLIPALATELDRLRQIAASKVPVLIGGETGTGKELIARGLHALSERPGPFLAVNCGALPETLLPSELFGHKKGAFSGAVQDRAGVVRDAHRGTLLLDEIGDLPASAQAVLLRVLQEGEVVPVGSSAPVPVDVRIASASHRDLEALVGAGEFREDLLARLSGFRFALPALRERREDLGILIGELLAGGADGAPALTVEAGHALLASAWPRNVRELEQSLTAALALAGAGPIGLEHLPDSLLDAPDPEADLSADDRALRGALIDALRAHGGNVTAAARQLGKARQQVQRWLKRFDIEPSRYR